MVYLRLEFAEGSKQVLGKLQTTTPNLNSKGTFQTLEVLFQELEEHNIRTAENTR